MTKETPDYLKLHTEEITQAAAEPPPCQPPTAVDRLTQSFTLATGWNLRADQIPMDGHDIASTRLAVAGPDANFEDQLSPPIELYKARQLAEFLEELLGELDETRHALWKREAELAAGVPIAARQDEEAHLAFRLESILQGGAEAVSCQAAAMYLLDDATTQLKLRACWGLPKERLRAPARPLRGAVADLEALVGHAVALEDTSLLPHWKVPEEFPSAICVPISTPTEPLGTLWMFCDRIRDFTAEQANLVEIIAGRAASELQRAMLLNECVAARDDRRFYPEAADWQRHHLPTIAPLLDQWQVAGWSITPSLANGFYDWFVPADGSLSVAVGRTEGSCLEAGMNAAALQAAVRAHSNHAHDTAKLVADVNETMWTSSATGYPSALCYAQVAPETGELSIASAGDIAGVIIRGSDVEELALDSIPLGIDPDWAAVEDQRTLEQGDRLVLVSDGKVASCERVIEVARQNHHATASELATAIEAELGRSLAADGSSLGLILQRR